MTYGITLSYAQVFLSAACREGWNIHNYGRGEAPFVNRNQGIEPVRFVPTLKRTQKNTRRKMPVLLTGVRLVAVTERRMKMQPAIRNLLVREPTIPSITNAENGHLQCAFRSSAHLRSLPNHDITLQPGRRPRTHPWPRVILKVLGAVQSSGTIAGFRPPISSTTCSADIIEPSCQPGRVEA